MHLRGIPADCDSGLPTLCCGAGPATWSYHEFLSITPLGVVPCTNLHLENLFAGHTGNPLQKIVSQTWEPGAYRERNWKGSQPLLHELYSSCCESSELSSMFGPQLFPKKNCNIHLFQTCTDRAILTLIVIANFQPFFFFSLLNSVRALPVLGGTGPSVYVQVMEKYYFCTKWAQYVPKLEGLYLQSWLLLHIAWIFLHWGPNLESI